MGKLNEFWNTNARPDGRLGRLALRMMNVTHSPMAKWNLSLIDFQPRWTILDVGCGGGRKRIGFGICCGVSSGSGSWHMAAKQPHKKIINTIVLLIS